jgi:hypothetical protein
MSPFFSRPFAILCLWVSSFPLDAQQHTRIAIGPVIACGEQLSKGYAIGLDIEPSLVRSVRDNIDVGAGILCNIFINNYNDATRDYLILYGPLLSGSYKGIKIKKIPLEPIFGAGYIWGRDFVADRSKSVITHDYFSNRISLLNGHGLYGRVGTSILLSAGTRICITYSLYRPHVTVDEEAKQFFPYSFSTALYGNTAEFPARRMNYDTVLIGIVLGL